MSKPNRWTWREFKEITCEGFICLVPEGLGVSCHEKTLCDCEVLNFLKDTFEINDKYIDHLEAENERLMNYTIPGYQIEVKELEEKLAKCKKGLLIMAEDRGLVGAKARILLEEVFYED